jgi:riboflavin synthase
MFSGIVEMMGIILAISVHDACKTFEIKPDVMFDDVFIGDSVAVNGACLTVIELTDATFKVTAVPVTLQITNLDLLDVGSCVNLERAVKVDMRIGGHYVQGHVDGVGEILEIHQQGGALLVKIGMPKVLAKYMVNKGYVAIDGMSITIIEAALDWFAVTFIPHTKSVTIVDRYQVGHLVNLETDMLAKHVEKLLGGYVNAASN